MCVFFVSASCVLSLLLFILLSLSLSQTVVLMATAKAIETQAITLVNKGAFTELTKLLEDYELEVTLFVF